MKDHLNNYIKDKETVKVFVSVPMRGRTEDEIDKSIIKLVSLFEAATGKKCIYDHNHVDYSKMSSDIKHQKVWNIGEAILKMSDCDVVLSPFRDWEAESFAFKGCDVELKVAHAYDIPVVYFDWQMIPEFEDIKYL